MPTTKEQDELRTKCKWIWTTLSGKRGYKVVGPNGNFIFLPAAGGRSWSSLNGAGSSGYFWSSSLCSSGSDYAYVVYFNSICYDWGSNDRYYGQSVRGVIKPATK